LALLGLTASFSTATGYMTEYVNVRASEILDQGDLVKFLKSRFPDATRNVGHAGPKGTECVEVRVPSNSIAFEEIREFINTRRKQGLHGFSKFTIGWYLRKYSEPELEQAEILRLLIPSHFESCGEECGTIYETVCERCNWGRQVSDLILDLRRVPQRKDISETIAWVEWVVSSTFAHIFTENRLTGAEFRPIYDFRNPSTRSDKWRQLWITGTIGRVAEKTKLGMDPFNDSEVSWRCPLGHSVVTQFLSETYFHRETWEGSDIAVTSSLFGQGQNVMRPTPLIIISQRLYRVIRQAQLKGFSYEIAHLV
jgi:hypothetical protein